MRTPCHPHSSEQEDDFKKTENHTEEASPVILGMRHDRMNQMMKQASHIHHCREEELISAGEESGERSQREHACGNPRIIRGASEAQKEDHNL